MGNIEVNLVVELWFPHNLRDIARDRSAPNCDDIYRDCTFLCAIFLQYKKDKRGGFSLGISVRGLIVYEVGVSMFLVIHLL